MVFGFHERKEQSLKAILTTKNVIGEMTKFLDSQEKNWGSKVTNITSNQISQNKLFSVQKAISITRMKRKPSEVTEGFIKASGSVNGIKSSN